MDALTEMRQKFRDIAASHARLARKHERLANGAEHQNWYGLYRTEASTHYTQYRAFKKASRMVANAQHCFVSKSKAEIVKTLRAMR